MKNGIFYPLVVFILVGILILITFGYWYLNHNTAGPFPPILDMTNTSGCTDETCNLISECGAGSDLNRGCVVGDQHYEWKDPFLRSKYKQISSDQAKECAQKFISDNRDKFTLYNKNSLDEQLYVTGTEKLDNSGKELYVGPFDDKDTYFWRVYNDLELQVGAQTCKVYPLRAHFGFTNHKTSEPKKF